MNFESKLVPIKADASFRKFYRKKIKKKSSIIVYAEKEKIQNLLNYDSVNKLLLKKDPERYKLKYGTIKTDDRILMRQS